MGAKPKTVTQKMRNLSEELEDTHNSDLFHSLFDLHNSISEFCPELIHIVEAEIGRQFSWSDDSQSEIEFMLKYAIERVRNVRGESGTKKYPWVDKKFGLSVDGLAHQAIINLISHGSGYDPSLPIGQKKTYINRAVKNVFNDITKSRKDEERLNATIVPFDPDRDENKGSEIDIVDQVRLISFIKKNFTEEDLSDLAESTQKKFGKIMKDLLEKYGFDF